MKYITNSKYPSTITEVFAAQVKADPLAPAVCDEHRSVTYGELDRLSDSIAARLPAGVQFVGIIMDHGIEMIATILAVLKSGAAYVPIEPSFPKERIRYILEHCEASSIVTEASYVGLCDAKPTILIKKGEQAASALPVYKQGSICGRSLAYVLYTSGTTGHPKGVMVEHRNVCHYVRAFKAEFNPIASDVMLQNSVCTFDIFVEEVFAALLSGAKLAIPLDETKNDISKLVDFINTHKVTIVSGFPYLMSELNKLEELPKDLRLLISGGDVLRSDYVSNLIDKVPIYNTYGPTETTVCATYFLCNDHVAEKDGTYPIGKAVLGAEVFLLDDKMQPVEPGEIGEICIAGDGVSRGYMGNVDESKNFTTDKNSTRFYRSGDLGYILADGNLHFVKRNDEQVMIGGKRVEPREVELVLSHAHHVEHAVVTARIDESGSAYLTAYIVSDSRNLSILDLRGYLAQYVPDFMIPKYFVILKEMPLTLNGKVDHKALPIVAKRSPA